MTSLDWLSLAGAPTSNLGTVSYPERRRRSAPYSTHATAAPTVPAGFELDLQPGQQSVAPEIIPPGGLEHPEPPQHLPPATPPDDTQMAKIGKKKDGRPIIQPKESAKQNQALATEAAPELDQKLRTLAGAVPGAKFARLRPEKSKERTDEKTDAQEPETMTDYLAAQIAVETPAAKDQMLRALKKNFKVLDVSDKFLEEGSEGGGFPSTQVQVQLSNGSSAQVQIVPREVMEVTDTSHPFYEKGREAEARGDKAERDRQWGKAAEINQGALKAFKARNAGEGEEDEHAETRRALESAGYSLFGRPVKVGKRVFLPVVRNGGRNAGASEDDHAGARQALESAGYSMGRPVAIGKRLFLPVSRRQPSAGEAAATSDHPYKYGSTQINLRKGTPAQRRHAALTEQIPEAHVGPVNGREEAPHITLRYGLQDVTPQAVDRIRQTVAGIQPFEVSLGRTAAFPATEHSDQEVPLHSAVEKTPELLALRKAVESAGDFSKENFPEYKPHVTLTYVKPGKEKAYVGTRGLEGQKVLVDHIVVTDRDGNQVEVPLRGAGSTLASSLTKGQRVRLKDGSSGTVLYVHPGMKIARIKLADTTKTVSLKDVRSG